DGFVLQPALRRVEVEGLPECASEPAHTVGIDRRRARDCASVVRERRLRDAAHEPDRSAARHQLTSALRPHGPWPNAIGGGRRPDAPNRAGCRRLSSNRRDSQLRRRVIATTSRRALTTTVTAPTPIVP